MIWTPAFKMIMFEEKMGITIHGLAPSYLADELHYPAESEFRRRLRSASSYELSIPRTRLSTYGDRDFAVADVRIWNTHDFIRHQKQQQLKKQTKQRKSIKIKHCKISLPQHITPAPSLPVFCSRLKTYFFELCYTRNSVVVPAKWHGLYGHVDRSYLLTYKVKRCMSYEVTLLYLYRQKKTLNQLIRHRLTQLSCKLGRKTRVLFTIWWQRLV